MNSNHKALESAGGVVVLCRPSEGKGGEREKENWVQGSSREVVE